jgi:phosphoribosylformylglycinamidine synthase
VAGLCDATGRVFGLMPHPERFCHPTHHPQWTRHDPQLRRKPDGLAIFENAVRYFR